MSGETTDEYLLYTGVIMMSILLSFDIFRINPEPCKAIAQNSNADLTSKQKKRALNVSIYKQV